MNTFWTPLAFYGGWLLCTWVMKQQFKRLNTVQDHMALASHLHEIMDKYNLSVQDEMALDQARVLLAWGLPTVPKREE